jgi:CRISPR-associated endonuclease Cas2
MCYRSIKLDLQYRRVDNAHGIEGYAAKTYFGSFTCMIRANRETFALLNRNKRPPRDPINALLSFIYTLLKTETKEGRKRLRKVATVCKDYGKRVQLSVFECRVSDSQYETLRDRLFKTIDPTLDSCKLHLIAISPLVPS